MIVQARWLKPEYRHWDGLYTRDRELFAHIAAHVVLNLWAWLSQNEAAL
jgi:hypothetical protein